MKSNRDKMYNDYQVQPSKKTNLPSCNLKEFADDKGVNARALSSYITLSDVRAAYNRGKINYYHKSSLDAWWESNKSKFNKGKE